MTPDQKLQAFLEADRPAPRDYVFEVEVARRVAARRAWLSGLGLAPWAMIAAVVLWALHAAIAPRMGDLAAAAVPMAMALSLAGSGVFAALWLIRRFSAA